MTESRGTVPLYFVGPPPMTTVVDRRVAVERKLTRGPKKGAKRLVETLSAELQPMMTAMITEVKDGNW